MGKNRLLVLSSCMQCPYMITQDTPRAGSATDYLCSASPAIGAAPKDPAEHGLAATYRMIAGYIEWNSELLQQMKDGPPQWCPLPTTTREPIVFSLAADTPRNRVEADPKVRKRRPNVAKDQLSRLQQDLQAIAHRAGLIKIDE